MNIMVGVAQLVEPRIVIPVVVGSSPIVHPIFRCSVRSEWGPVAIFREFRFIGPCRRSVQHTVPRTIVIRPLGGLGL